MCNKLVKAILQEAMSSQVQTPTLPLLSWNIQLNRETIYDNIIQIIRSYIVVTKLVLYISKLNLPPDMFHKICWTLLGETLNIFSKMFQL